ncbi:hypothetical protein [Rhodococcoides fascians]|uniref:hypothetical protein n=1 Tax=Rhodococcoides fascians TaxID=1828 RepID=UPI000561E73D|nr:MULTISPECIES: hypothetical protein [Rhodococcus]OZF00448.1 hypothetical protein CH301_12190 [Rhodococcus sp. 15-1189-1-1a]OZF14329.1 hypothetical protein CH299_12870 [Rhodococcus sp. 14-2686-1-2]
MSTAVNDTKRIVRVGVLVSALSILSACATDQGSVDAGLYPVPVAPAAIGQGTFIRFETGWRTESYLAEGVETRCARRTAVDSTNYSATTSAFDLFDSGSDKPGQDFSVDLFSYPEDAGAAVSGPTASLTMAYVSEDGVHHDLRALDNLVIDIREGPEPGVGFSAVADVYDLMEKSNSVAVTGFVQCSSIEEY